MGCYVTYVYIYLYFETPWASKRSESQTFQTQIFGRPVSDIKATWYWSNGARKLHGHGWLQGSNKKFQIRKNTQQDTAVVFFQEWNEGQQTCKNISSSWRWSVDRGNQSIHRRSHCSENPNSQQAANLIIVEHSSWVACQIGNNPVLVASNTVLAMWPYAMRILCVTGLPFSSVSC